MKRLCTLVVTVFLLSGCGVSQQAAFRQAQQIFAECKQRRLAGELQGYAASARCSQDRVRQIIAESRYPYMDLIDLQFAYDMAVAERIDKGELSEAEGQLLSAELRTRISSEEQRRNAIRAAQAQAANEPLRRMFDQINENLQRQRDRDALMAPRTMAPITCYQYGNMVQCR